MHRMLIPHIPPRFARSCPPLLPPSFLFFVGATQTSVLGWLSSVAKGDRSAKLPSSPPNLDFLALPFGQRLVHILFTCPKFFCLIPHSPTSFFVLLDKSETPLETPLICLCFPLCFFSLISRLSFSSFCANFSSFYGVETFFMRSYRLAPIRRSRNSLDPFPVPL